MVVLARIAAASPGNAHLGRERYPRTIGPNGEAFLGTRTPGLSCYAGRAF